MLTMQGGDSLVGGLPIIHITYQQYIANPSAYQDPDVIVHITGFPTAGNMPADYVGYDSNLNMEDIGNIATKAIAKVEPSDTALYLHPVGSYFINKDGNACVTDVQISVGGAITLGTNCHVVDGVANDINSNLSWKLLSNTISNDSNVPTVVDVTGYKEFYVYAKPVYSGFANVYVRLLGNMWLSIGTSSQESADIMFNFSGNSLSIYGSFSRNGSQVTPAVAYLYGR